MKNRLAFLGFEGKKLSTGITTHLPPTPSKGGGDAEETALRHCGLDPQSPLLSVDPA